LLPFNPQACWDWWSYVDHEDSYVTKSGSQIRTIKAMLDALTARAVPAPAPAVAPTSLTVIDASDTGADLAWTPQAGTTVYRVRRAGADGQFAPLGDVAGASFADSGLTPQTAYRWRISAVANGIEDTAFIEAAAVTRAVPPPCENPGSCAIGK
jgi:poly(3-hydroxybutyrate) depolymerase